MPLRAIVRAALKSVVLLGLFFGLLFAAIYSTGATQLILVVATVVAAAIGILAAYIYIPGFDLLGRVPWRGRRGTGLVAITFDDGPNEPWTSQALDVLERHGAKGTFFLLGHAIEKHPEIARRIEAGGHAVGTHTYSHPKLHFLPRAVIADEIDRGEAALRAAGVRGHRLFRAPHGLKSIFLPSILRERGLKLCGWTDGVWDTDRPGADVIASRAAKYLESGEILLLHDGKPGLDRSQTVAALDLILEECRARGLRCVTLPELIEAK